MFQTTNQKCSKPPTSYVCMLHSLAHICARCQAVGFCWSRNFDVSNFRTGTAAFSASMWTFTGWEYHGNIMEYLQCEAPKIAKLVNITPISMVYGTQITIVFMGFINQLITGGPHIVGISYKHRISMKFHDLAGKLWVAPFLNDPRKHRWLQGLKGVDV